MKSNQNQVQKSASWWNRPLIGDKSFVQWLQDVVKRAFKQEVPSATVDLYRHSFTQLKNMSAIIRTLDNEKFSSQEFIQFLMLNRQFEQETGVFEGLKHSIELLRVALETKESFLKIEATELRYRSFSQQEFYDYIYDLLKQDLEVEKFQNAVQRELNDVIPKIKSDEGKAAIQSYVNELDIVCKDKLGLKLLFLFKQYDLSNFALLRTVAEIADSFYEKDLDTLKEFRVVVQVNVDIFLKLGQIIQVPQRKNEPETYAMILQYIALRNRHSKSFAQFQQLLSLLREWHKHYGPLLTILQEYPPREYKQPPIFKEPIPALEIFNKYENYV